MAALFLLAASCKKEKENEDTGFVATTESHAGDSKTHLSDQAVHWDVGDKIRVHSQVSATDLAQGWWDFKATGVNGKKADFTGVNENDFECVPQGFYKPDYTAVYPAEMVSAIGDKTCTISLPQEQTYVSGGFDLSANPMMAYSGTTTLNFKNICGLVEMQFYGENEEAYQVEYITLTSDDVNEMLWGSATVKFEGDLPTLKSLSDGGGDNTITLNCNDMNLSTNPDAPSVFHFVVPANTLAGSFTVQIHFTGSENVCVKHAPAGDAVGRSQILAMPPQAVAVKDPVVPSEVTIESIDDNSHTATCKVTFPDGSTPTVYGIVYSTTNTSPDIYHCDGNFESHDLSDKASANDITKRFTVNIGSLTEQGIHYYLRAYAKIDEVKYSECNDYYIKITPSEVTITNIDSQTAIANCTVTIPYGSLTTYGLVYSTTNTSPDIDHCDGYIESHNLIGNTFTVNISSLTEDCYVRAYAKIEGAAYSSTQTYTPLKPSQVTLVSGLDNITNTVTCRVTFTTGSSITECGLVYSTTDDTPTIAEGATKITGELDRVDTGKTFTVSSSSLTGTSLYYVRAYAKINGVTYSETKTYSTVPLSCSWTDGKSPYPFTVGSGKQVYFSSGNLQYKPSTATASYVDKDKSLGGTWRFAEHQFDLLHTTSDTDVSDEYKFEYSGWIDLFPWGTSGYNTISTGSSIYGYIPWTQNTNDGIFKPYNGTSNDLYSSTGKADWGVANTILNCGTGWRTLKGGTLDSSPKEWNYLMETRTKASELYGYGQIAGTKGLIILPDITYWNEHKPTDVTFKDSSISSSFSANTYSYADWSKMEKAGAVFLPAAGYRHGKEVTVDSKGYYWSSTHSDSTKGSPFIFNEGSNDYSGKGRHYGYSVRLVQDAD